MTILQLANAYGPRTGGIRTEIDALRACYRARGVRTVLVTPAERDSREPDDGGEIVRLRAPRLPINPDYRNLWHLAAVERLADEVGPDAVEIYDKWTLPRLAARLRQRGLPVLGFSCERLDRVLTPYLGNSPLAAAAIRRYNRWFCAQFDAVVCHSRYAAAELEAVGDRPLVVPLGVDLERFHPAARDEALRADLLGAGDRLLLYVGRLVPEKRVDLLVGLMTRLAPRGWRLAIAGSGPLAPTLAAAPGLTVLGFERERLPALYASCDGFVHPSPIEAFGLSVLEALASGAPVVGSAHGGVAELLPPWCPRSRACPAALAAAVEQAAALGRPAAARAVAERYPWAATAERVLALHGAVRQAAPLACSAAAR